ncbi:16539_t:CDS:1, partial [Racocetra fulgida]
GSSEFDVNFRFSYEIPPACFFDYSQNKNIKQACNTEIELTLLQDTKIQNKLEIYNMEVYSKFNEAWDFHTYNFPTLTLQSSSKESRNEQYKNNN